MILVTVQVVNGRLFMRHVSSKKPPLWGARKLAMGKWGLSFVIYLHKTPYYPIENEVFAPFKHVFKENLLHFVID
jgi:hypothetical protein